MKSTFRLFIGTTTLCLTTLLSGCGQPGPLYLPKAPPAKPVTSSDAPRPGVAPASAPIPSTPPASQQ
ncbi:lipoprotein [Duganella sp. HH101]|uniref:LPS translocon maturation chaperone LptM n=1 Tax=Duganella sp. HH101 TaxID=1781066 RepID=UPI00114D2FE2